MSGSFTKFAALRLVALLSFFLILPLAAVAAGTSTVPSVGPIRVEFILFAITLVCVALFHHKTMQVALIGLTVVVGFFVMLGVAGWHPHPPHKKSHQKAATEAIKK